MSLVRSDNTSLPLHERTAWWQAAPWIASARNALLRVVAIVSARWELLKPRVLLLVLLVCGLSGLLARPAELDRVVATILGTALMAGAGLIANQILERGADALMRRTRNRPIPSGRVGVAEAWAWSLLFGAGAVVCFWWFGLMLALALSLLSAVLYVAVYTPLKRVTAFNTVIGAVSGAMPPLIGWAGAGGSLEPLAWILFAVLFCWQFPHFFAIAWLWREEYRRAGFRMISVSDPDGRVTGRQAVLYCLPLLPLPLCALRYGIASPWYAVGVLVLGGAFLACAWEFYRGPSDRTARQLLRGSVLYLPILLLLMLTAVY